MYAWSAGSESHYSCHISQWRSADCYTCCTIAKRITSEWQIRMGYMASWIGSGNNKNFKEIEGRIPSKKSSGYVRSKGQTTIYFQATDCWSSGQEHDYCFVAELERRNCYRFDVDGSCRIVMMPTASVWKWRVRSLTEVAMTLGYGVKFSYLGYFQCLLLKLGFRDSKSSVFWCFLTRADPRGMEFDVELLNEDG